MENLKFFKNLKHALSIASVATATLSKRSRINFVTLEEECEAGDICQDLFS